MGLETSQRDEMAKPSPWMAEKRYQIVKEAPSQQDFKLMRAIEELRLKRPYYGLPRMTDWLSELGWRVNEKRVVRRG
jgi:hypothetical protein